MVKGAGAAPHPLFPTGCGWAQSWQGIKQELSPSKESRSRPSAGWGWSRGIPPCGPPGLILAGCRAGIPRAFFLQGPDPTPGSAGRYPFLPA